MWILMIVLLAALVGAFWKRRELGDKANTILVALVVLTLAVTVLSMVRSTRPPKVNVQPDFYLAAGAKLGEAIAAAVPGGGTVLLIHAGATGPTLKQIMDAQVAGLKQGFGDKPFDIVLAGPESEAEMQAMLMMEAQVPADLFAKYLQKAPGAKAVVSLVGAPDTTRGTLPATLPPVFLFGTVDSRMADDLIRAGLIRAAVCYRDDADWKAEPKRGMSIDEIFNLRYVMRTGGR